MLYSPQVELLRFGRSRHESVSKKVGRFVEDHILDADILDGFIVGTALGTGYLLKDYFARNRVRVQNNLTRRLENGNIAPLDPEIAKEIGHIAGSKF